MARPWKVPPLLLAILVALVAFSNQFRKKTFISVTEESAVYRHVPETLYYLNDQYNNGSEDKCSFRIFQVLQVRKQVTDHIEYYIQVMLGRTNCLKPKFSTCAFQEGARKKHVHCFFRVFVNPWNEKYKILKKVCQDIKFPASPTQWSPTNYTLNQNDC